MRRIAHGQLRQCHVPKRTVTPVRTPCIRAVLARHVHARPAGNSRRAVHRTQDGKLVRLVVAARVATCGGAPPHTFGYLQLPPYLCCALAHSLGHWLGCGWRCPRPFGWSAAPALADGWRVLMGGGLGLWAARFTTGLAPCPLVTTLAPRLLPDPIQHSQRHRRRPLLQSSTPQNCLSW